MQVKIPRMRVGYYDEARPTDVVTIGFNEIVETERYCRGKGIATDSAEGTLYTVWRAAKRMGLDGGLDFEPWKTQVAVVDSGEGEAEAPPV